MCRLSSPILPGGIFLLAQRCIKRVTGYLSYGILPILLTPERREHMMRRRAVRPRLGLFLLLGVLLTLIPLGLRAAEQPTPPEGLAVPGQSTSMPAFELPDANGETIRSADLQGKVVVVRFWASW